MACERAARLLAPPLGATYVIRRPHLSLTMLCEPPGYGRRFGKAQEGDPKSAASVEWAKPLKRDS